MARLIQIIPHGVNFVTGEDDRAQLKASLEALHRNVIAAGLRWSDVALLWLANSRAFGGADADEAELTTAQVEFDAVLLDELESFCAEQGWWPGLAGSSVKSSFCHSDHVAVEDVSDGLMWVAFSHESIRRAGVGVDLTGQGSPSRSAAGRRALDSAVASLLAECERRHGRAIDRAALCAGAIGLVFTSGSGHVAATAGGVDFRDCYSLGQKLLTAADSLRLNVIGGCASNRIPPQSQCLYFSTTAGDRQRYHVDYGHGAVMAVLPDAQVLIELDHPYKVGTGADLTLDFHPHERYSEEQFFCVRAINGRPPREFLQEHWTEISPEEFDEMVERGLPIPAKPRAYYFSIASSPHPQARGIWPNIPVYFEKVDGEVLLRLVRAESADAYFYSVRMTPDGLFENADDLRHVVEATSEPGDSLIAFLCESRKYVLEDLGSNREAECLAESRPESGNVVGVYLNGEYSTGQNRSIGYHNYSQIGALFTDTGVGGVLSEPA